MPRLPVLVLSALVLAACPQEDRGGFGPNPPPSPMPPSPSPPGTSAGPTRVLEVTAPGGLRFEPTTLWARAGETLEIVLRNLDSQEHTLAINELNTFMLAGPGQTVRVAVPVHPGNWGTFAFYCSRPGHREAGMEGTLRVRRSAAP